MPVRNGWPYVKECVESILAQSYRDFDLIVLDNQSTDNTVPWLKTLEDDRVGLLSSPCALSIADSWARAKDVEKQVYMTLIGHDDTLDPDFLITIKAPIDRNPDCALYQTGSRLINAEGKTVRACKVVPERESAAQYLESRFTFQRDVSGTGIVIRSADFDRLGGIPRFEKMVFADDALWLSLLGNSCKANDPAECFAVRIHPGSESASLPSVWSSILTGLGQFSDFLASFVQSKPEARAVHASLGPDFILAYHRNALFSRWSKPRRPAGGSILPRSCASNSRWPEPPRRRRECCVVRRKWPPWRRLMPHRSVSSFPGCGISIRVSKTDLYKPYPSA